MIECYTAKANVTLYGEKHSKVGTKVRVKSGDLEKFLSRGIVTQDKPESAKAK